MVRQDLAQGAEMSYQVRDWIETRREYERQFAELEVRLAASRIEVLAPSIDASGAASETNRAAMTKQINEAERHFGRTTEECHECGPIIFDSYSECYLVVADDPTAATYWACCSHDWENAR